MLSIKDMTDMLTRSPPDENPSSASVDVRTVRFEATDGHPLEGTLTTGDGDGPLVLISSATAVMRGFYQRFAESLVSEHGFGAALTYDYRGTGGSVSAAVNPRRMRMVEWAVKDFPAALALLEAQMPGTPVVGVGQSYGGLALPLSGTSDRFSRYLMVATISGYWRNLSDGKRVFIAMNFVGRPVATILGHVPPSLGMGTRIPGGIFLDWVKWCGNPEWFFADTRFDAKSAFASVKTPILAIGATDDPWGTPKARDDLMRHFTRAPVRTEWLEPEQAGGPIGHLDFFRSRFRDTLWPEPIAWLKSADNG